LLTLFQKQQPFINLMTQKTLSQKQKKALLTKIFTGQIKPLLVNSLCLMVERYDFAKITVVLETCLQLLNRHLGIVQGQVYSIHPLSSAQITTLNAKMSRVINKQVVLTNIVQKQLLGGLKVVIDHQIYDNSYYHQLQKLAASMRKGKDHGT